jgi:hypothetical protein
MAFLVISCWFLIGVGIPRLARQCQGIMNQSRASGQTNLGREQRIWPVMPRRNAALALGAEALCRGGRDYSLKKNRFRLGARPYE